MFSSRASELPESLAEVLRVFVRGQLENHRHDPQLLRLMMEHPPNSTALRERITRYERANFTYLLDLLGRHPEVRVADLDTATRLVIATIQYTVHPLVAAPAPVDPARLENEIVAMLTRYLKAG